MNLIYVPLVFALSMAQPSVAIVSYRIAAPPNSVVRYADESYTVGKSGSIELVADPATTTVSLGETVFNLPQNGPTDRFGSVTISLMPQTEGYKQGLRPKGAKQRMAR